MMARASVRDPLILSSSHPLIPPQPTEFALHHHVRSGVQLYKRHCPLAVCPLIYHRNRGRGRRASHVSIHYSSFVIPVLSISHSDFVLLSQYKTIFDSVHELVCSPYQTPFTLFQIVVFSLRFYSQTELLSVTNMQATEDFVMMLRVFYIVALEATGNVDLSDAEQ